jgi:hypothetical protein
MPENKGPNVSEDPTSVEGGLGPKARLRQARSAEERAMIRDGLPYKRGFAKPPEETQFRRGQSGNPKGRPKGRKDLITLLDEALEERTEVIEHGKRRKLPKSQVLMKQLANQASAGNLKATSLILEAMRKYGRLDAPAPQAAVVDDRDRATIERFAEFLGIAEAQQPAPALVPDEDPDDTHHG